MNKKSDLLFFILMSIVSSAQEVKVTSGKIQRFANFKSQYVDARNIDVWLPDGYSDKEKYAVVYMHDGQMLLDAEQTWNKKAWEVDQVAGKLINEEKTRKFIVVGIWNNNLKRHPEYFPEKPYQELSVEQKDYISNILLKKIKINQEFHPISDNYLKFMVTELKPFIDKTFATKSDKDNTFIAGSSMGGLISLYAICEYPEIFGGAACLSTHWIGIYQVEDNPIPEIFYTYLRKNLPSPKNHKIYFDYGDQTLDSFYKPYQEKIDAIMVEKGFTNINWITKFLPGKDHSETSWKERLDIPLEFLLKK